MAHIRDKISVLKSSVYDIEDIVEDIEDLVEIIPKRIEELRTQLYLADDPTEQDRINFTISELSSIKLSMEEKLG